MQAGMITLENSRRKWQTWVSERSLLISIKAEEGQTLCKDESLDGAVPQKGLPTDIKTWFERKYGEIAAEIRSQPSPMLTNLIDVVSNHCTVKDRVRTPSGQDVF